MRHRFEIVRTWQGAMLPFAEQAWVECERARDSLSVWWDAPYWQEPSPSIPSGECPDLWRYQAVELFLASGADQSYLELEFGPAGHWLALEFSAYRCLRARRDVHSYTWRVEASRFVGRALISGLPLLLRVSRGNAHVVHRSADGRSHCSAHGDPGATPDFHRSDLFLPLDGGSPGRV